MAFEQEENALYYHDGTERPIQRPGNPKVEPQHYSGKKTAYGKEQGPDQRLLPEHFSDGHGRGQKACVKKLADQSNYTLPDGSTLAQDTGFQGFKLENVAILQPKKKPNGGQLSDLDKDMNGWISSLRICIEHAIGSVKRYRMVKDRVRNWKTGFKDTLLETCCGLHNFRLSFRPWSYPPLQLDLFVPF